jgi:hypothetical protein
LAGPLANVGVAAVFGSAAWYLYAPGSIARGMAIAIAAFSALLALTNLFPIGVTPARANRIDGPRFRRLGTGSGAQAYLTETRLLALALRADRPRNWPNTEVDRVRQVIASATQPATTADELRSRLLAGSLQYYLAIEYDRPDIASDLVGDVLKIARTRKVNDTGLYVGLDLLVAFRCAFRESNPAVARAILLRLPAQAPVNRLALWHGTWAAIHLAEAEAGGTGLEDVERAWLLALAAPIRETAIPRATPATAAPVRSVWPLRTDEPTIGRPPSFASTMSRSVEDSWRWLSCLFCAVVFTALMMHLLGASPSAILVDSLLLIAGVNVGLALWFAREANLRWAIFAIVGCGAALPVYLFCQYRGSNRDTDGQCLTPFPLRGAASYLGLIAVVTAVVSIVALVRGAPL